MPFSPFLSLESFPYGEVGSDDLEKSSFDLVFLFEIKNKQYSAVLHGNITPDETTVYVIMFHKKLLVSTDMKKSYRGRDFNVLEIFAIFKHP